MNISKNGNIHFLISGQICTVQPDIQILNGLYLKIMRSFGLSFDNQYKRNFSTE